jgi:hypothetical protein
MDPRAELRERKRAQAVEEIPRWYSPWGHLAATTGIGIVVLGLGIHGIHALRWQELLVVPVLFLIANGFEWRAHRDVLHKRQRFLEEIYDRHTPQHHAIFMTEDMAIRSNKEFRLVLMPALGVLGIVVVLAPLSALIGCVLTKNCGWLMLVTSGLYMVTYELSHLSYHLPEDSFIGRRWLVRVLREHHARHHDPRLMQRWNFNVTIPIFDWLMGTMASRVEWSTKADGSRPRGAHQQAFELRPPAQPRRSGH